MNGESEGRPTSALSALEHTVGRAAGPKTYLKDWSNNNFQEEFIFYCKIEAYKSGPSFIYKILTNRYFSLGRGRISMLLFRNIVSINVFINKYLVPLPLLISCRKVQSKAQSILQ